MKARKITMAVAASALLLAAPAMAFHDGGVAKCEGCHTMHNSLNNAVMGGGTILQSGPFLLQGGGQASDSCLNCHESGSLSGYKVSTSASAVDYTLAKAPAQRTPGGDFRWLSVATLSTQSKKDSRGHNVLGTGHAFAQDSRLVTSPGGSYPANNLQCSSCHDPHGKYRRLSDGTVVQSKPGVAVPGIADSGSYGFEAANANEAAGVYRILGGIGYLPKSVSDASLAFANDVPVAVAPSSYNQSESANQIRVAYGSGMSEWCANCHAGMLNADGVVSGSNTDGGHVHPAGNNAKLNGGSSDSSLFATTILTNYNSYKKTGDMTGTSATSFDSLVPFEEGTAASIATLAGHASNSNGYTAGPDGNSTVMCLSCHRAHASGWESMLRYEVANTFVNGTDSTGTVTGWAWNADANLEAYKLAANNGKLAANYAPFQRPLCNKCHAKD